MLDLLLSLLPVLVILTCRKLCTLTPPPVPKYLEKKPRNGCGVYMPLSRPRP